MLKILRTGLGEKDPGRNYKGKLKVACLRWLGHSSEKQGPGPVVYFLRKPNQVTTRVYTKRQDSHKMSRFAFGQEERGVKYPFLVRILELS